MYCRVCGSEEGVTFRASKLQALCEACDAETPRKVSREAFEKRFWGKHIDEVPHGTRREFYQDYLRGDRTLAQYCAEARSSA